MIFQLLQNARQAMSEGGKILILAKNVSLSTGEVGDLPAGHYVCWFVEDQGSGISGDLLKWIFDTGLTTLAEERPKQSGLGLAVCRSIIEKHKGHIECCSLAGKGTTFIVYLPAVSDV